MLIKCLMVEEMEHFKKQFFATLCFSENMKSPCKDGMSVNKALSHDAPLIQVMGALDPDCFIPLDSSFTGDMLSLCQRQAKDEH